MTLRVFFVEWWFHSRWSISRGMLFLVGSHGSCRTWLLCFWTCACFLEETCRAIWRIELGCLVVCFWVIFCLWLLLLGWGYPRGKIKLLLSSCRWCFSLPVGVISAWTLFVWGSYVQGRDDVRYYAMYILSGLGKFILVFCLWMGKTTY